MVSSGYKIKENNSVKGGKCYVLQYRFGYSVGDTLLQYGTYNTLEEAEEAKRKAIENDENINSRLKDRNVSRSFNCS